MTKSSDIHDALHGRKCPGGHQHQVAEGSHTTASGHYPTMLAAAIHSGYATQHRRSIKVICEANTAAEAWHKVVRDNGGAEAGRCGSVAADVARPAGAGVALLPPDQPKLNDNGSVAAAVVETQRGKGGVVALNANTMKRISSSVIAANSRHDDPLMPQVPRRCFPCALEQSHRHRQRCRARIFEAGASGHSLWTSLLCHRLRDSKICWRFPNQ